MQVAPQMSTRRGCDSRLACEPQIAISDVRMMDGTGSFANTLQRSRGAAEVAFRAGALDQLYQSGAAKALLQQRLGGARLIQLVKRTSAKGDFRRAA